MSGVRDGRLAVGPPPTVIDSPNDMRRSGGAVLLVLRSLPVLRRDLRLERVELERELEADRRSERERPPDTELEDEDEKSRKERNVDGRDSPDGPAPFSSSASLLRDRACMREWGNDRPPALRYLSVRLSGRRCSCANSTLSAGMSSSPSSSDIGEIASDNKIPRLLSRPCMSRGPRPCTLR